MSEKTGIEILSELVEQFKILNKKVDLLDQNVKILMNRLKQDKVDERIKPQVPQKASIQAVEPELKKAPQPAQEKKMTIQTKYKRPGVMVNSKIIVMIDKVPTPIPDALIRIFNEQDQLIKETKTNRGGVWIASLPPGKYVAEITGKFKGKELVTQNKNFIIPQGVAEFEVR